MSTWITSSPKQCWLMIISCLVESQHSNMPTSSGLGDGCASLHNWPNSSRMSCRSTLECYYEQLTAKFSSIWDSYTMFKHYRDQKLCTSTSNFDEKFRSIDWACEWWLTTANWVGHMTLANILTNFQICSDKDFGGEKLFCIFKINGKSKLVARKDMLWYQLLGFQGFD